MLIPGYKIITIIDSKVHGSLMYERKNITEYKIINCHRQHDIESITIHISGITIMAVYKPPNVKWPNCLLSTLEYQGVYKGDFNCRHADWGYSSNDENGEILSNWIVNNDLPPTSSLR